MKSGRVCGEGVSKQPEETVEHHGVNGEIREQKGHGPLGL